MAFLQNFMDGTHLAVVIILFAVGLVAIIKGGDWFVDSASWMAEATGIPKLIVGATVVSVGTTLPELLVSTIAAAGGEYDMAAGNAIGSVTANTALILSLALIFMPTVIKRKDYYFKSALLFLPLILMFASAFNGNANSNLPLWTSILMLCIFAVNIGENVVGAMKSAKQTAQDTLEGVVGDKLEQSDLQEKDGAKKKKTREPIAKKTLWVKIGFFALGAAAIFVGAQLLQTSATTIATKLGVGKQIIALTIVAIGTSLPELVTTITAIAKKEQSLSAGNIIGANILDLTLILAICGVISGGTLPMSAQTVLLDIPVCFLVSCVAIVPALIQGKFSRWQGVLNIAIYIAYLVIMIVGVGSIGIYVPAV